MNKMSITDILLLFILSFIPKAHLYTVDPTSVDGTISQTTTTFYTPRTQTSTFFVTYTPPTSIKMVTETATPSTSVVVSVTVANINIGNRSASKLPYFLNGGISSGINSTKSKSTSVTKTKSKTTSTAAPTPTSKSKKKKKKQKWYNGKWY